VIPNEVEGPRRASIDVRRRPSTALRFARDDRDLPLPRPSSLASSNALFFAPMMFRIQLAALFVALATAHAQIQLDLSFKRIQYIAHEPILATVKIANNSGRDIDL